MLDASVRTDVGASVSTGRPRAQTPATRTVAVQTMYRESETQTDPWTPEYVVRPGSAPEVLTLATLSYGWFCLFRTSSIIPTAPRPSPLLLTAPA